jgi:tripartite-type tricarboxylate transporter receptor subunit TctC
VPKDIHRRLTKVFSDILEDPGTRKRLDAEATELRNATPDEFRSLIRKEVKKWTSVAKTAGIQLQ